MSNHSSVSFASILPLFTQIDIQHMGRRGVKLDDFSYMADPAGGSLGDSPVYPDHAHARGTYSYLTGETQPQMPLRGTPWTPENLALYNQWMNDGFKP